MNPEKSTLVIAFDGLDYELIQEFDLKHIPQKEFGRIDNTTGISSRKTSELFASFITGETNEEHGVKGLKKKENLIPRLISDNVAFNIRGFYTLREILRAGFGRDHRYYDKSDINTTTWFDEIENSKALDVPCYNPSPFWMKAGITHLRELTWEDHSYGYYWDNYEYARRKRELFRPVNKWYDFCLAHIHRPDAHQHFYGDRDLDTFDKEKLKKLYFEIDQLAADIVEFFSDSYDRIVFMSDHGLPTGQEHNRNAFYSCNEELFGGKTPKITDFYHRLKDGFIPGEDIPNPSKGFAGEKEKKVYQSLKRRDEL